MALGDEMSDTNVIAHAAIPARSLASAEVERLFQAAAHDYQEHWPRYGSRQTLPLTNFFTGEHIRFEASPGNVMLRPAVGVSGWDAKAIPQLITNGYELVWHDLDGAEALTNPVPPW
jgi:hypothetical protein